ASVSGCSGHLSPPPPAGAPADRQLRLDAEIRAAHTIDTEHAELALFVFGACLRAHRAVLRAAAAQPTTETDIRSDAAFGTFALLREPFATSQAFLDGLEPVVVAATGAVGCLLTATIDEGKVSGT